MLLLWLTACLLVSGDDLSDRLDLDGDGIARPDDCDDTDPTVGLAVLWFVDSDGDGFGNSEITQVACEQPEGHVADRTDCDDTRADVHPVVPWYLDADGDGFGDPAQVVLACYAPDDHVADDRDCDDTRDDVNPDAPERCDPADLDEDCDGLADDLDDDVLADSLSTWWPDVDADGYGADDVEGVAACDDPGGMVDNDGDCDDSAAELNPGGEDSCGWRDIAGSVYTACAVRWGGQLHCWGEDGSTTNDFPEGSFVDVEVVEENGYRGACALDSDGAAHCWGNDFLLETPEQAGFVDLWVGTHGACALDLLGEPTCWGLNNYRHVPTGPFVALAGGWRGVCALAATGEATCWVDEIDAGYGELGAGPWLDLQGNYRNACGLKVDGSVVCTDPGDEPSPSYAYDRFAVGLDWICGLDPADDTVRCGGSTSYIGDAIGRKLSSIQASAYTLCGIDLDRCAWCFSNTGRGGDVHLGSPGCG